jgi:hypothetical protein
MRSFVDAQGRAWVASAREEDTPRHHGRWYLVFHPADDDADVLPIPEVRWQTRATAARTLDTMSDFELLRRLNGVLGRTVAPPRTTLSSGASASDRE